MPLWQIVASDSVALAGLLHSGLLRQLESICKDPVKGLRF